MFWYLQKAWKSVRGKKPNDRVFSTSPGNLMCLTPNASNGLRNRLRTALETQRRWVWHEKGPQLSPLVTCMRAVVKGFCYRQRAPVWICLPFGSFIFNFFYIQNLNRDWTACHSFWRKNYVQWQKKNIRKPNYRIRIISGLPSRKKLPFFSVEIVPYWGNSFIKWLRACF